MEILRSKRDKRRRGSSKNDAIDAGTTARNTAAEHGTCVLKSRDGWSEAVRALLDLRELCVRTSTAASSAAKSLDNIAPEPLRSKYEKMSVLAMMKSLARKRSATGSAVTDALHTSLHVLAKTWIDSKQRADELEALISDLVRDNAPALLEIDGCDARQRRGRQPRKAPLKSSTRLALRRLADRGVERQDRQAQAQPGR